MFKTHTSSCAGPEGGGGGRGSGSPEKSQIYRVSSQKYWSGSPENHKATKPAFILGNYRPASETPFQYRFAGRPIIARFWWFLEPRAPQKTYKSCIPSDITL